MDPQKTLEDLKNQMNEAVAELAAMGHAMQNLGDIELLVSYDDLAERFALPHTPFASVPFHAVRA